MPTTHEISAEIVRRWDELARDGVINREETIRQIIQGMLDAAARCVYCNSLFKLNTPEEKEAIVKHVMSCDKNPMTEIYEEAKKIVEAFKSEADRSIFGVITQAGTPQEPDSKPRLIIEVEEANLRALKMLPVFRACRVEIYENESNPS